MASSPSPISLLIAAVVASFFAVAGGLAISDVHDLLELYGLPKGLVPNNVKSYSLSDDGFLEIELESSCYVRFSKLVSYEKKIRGKIRYGEISDVSGIRARETLIWMPITGIFAPPKSNYLEFQVGFSSEVWQVSEFETIRHCRVVSST